jgi:spermidine synthase
MAWAAYVLMESLPFWPIDVTLVTDPWHKLQLDLIRCSWAVLPAAILWGASFPLALGAVAAPGQDPGRLVGGVYAANTLGAILGSMGASLILVVWIGSQHALQLLIAISAVSALIMLAPRASALNQSRAMLRFTGFVLLVTGAGVLLALTVSGVPREFVAYGRSLPTRGKQADVFYMGEGLTSSVAVSRMPNGILNYHNAGKVQASSDPADMRLQRMLGHLTTLVPQNQGSFLVIGCGAGVTAGAVSIEPRAQSVTIAEIEPLVPEVVSTYFGEHNFNVIRNPKVRVEIDDGRHFLQTTDQKFDGITSDPLDPWVKGAAMLYTREFWELARQRLNPGGVVTVFVQLYESTEEAVKSELATFFEVFPNGSVWANTVFGQGYDLVLLGQVEPTRINLDVMQERLGSPEYAEVAKSLSEIGFYSVTELFSTFAGTATDLKPWLAGAAINRDRNLRLQYLAGMGLNLYQANPIYLNMTASGIRFPAELFSGSPDRIEALRYSIEAGQRP